MLAGLILSVVHASSPAALAITFRSPPPNADRLPSGAMSIDCGVGLMSHSAAAHDGGPGIGFRSMSRTVSVSFAWSPSVTSVSAGVITMECGTWLGSIARSAHAAGIAMQASSVAALFRPMVATFFIFVVRRQWVRILMLRYQTGSPWS